MRNTEAFNLRFNETVFNRALNNEFNSLEDLKTYFISFRKHYDIFSKSFDPKSSIRMKGKAINDYKTQQKYSCTLEDHYGLLLTVGKNGFNIWLNDLVK